MEAEGGRFPGMDPLCCVVTGPTEGKQGWVDVCTGWGVASGRRFPDRVLRRLAL